MAITKLLATNTNAKRIDTAEAGPCNSASNKQHQRQYTLYIIHATKPFLHLKIGQVLLEFKSHVHIDTTSPPILEPSSYIKLSLLLERYQGNYTIYSAKASAKKILTYK